MQNGYTELITYRYERKFVSEHFSSAETEAVVKQNSGFFTPLFHPRRVNNIYFDTPGLDCFFDNLFGNGNRWKVRVRWYNDIFGEIGSPILEFKIKKGLVGTKKSFRLPGFTLNKNSFDAGLLGQLFAKANLPADVKERLATMQPVLLNTYQRSYFSTFNKKFRITIDSELEYYNLRPTWNSFQFKFIEQRKTVVELKYDEQYNNEADTITNQFPFRLNKNSKFVAGMNHFRNEIPE